MRYLVHSMQRPGLTDAENLRLYEAMGVFYSKIPEGVTLECDYVRADKLGSYSVLSVPDRGVLDRILAPFDGLVVLDVVEVMTAQESMAGG